MGPTMVRDINTWQDVASEVFVPLHCRAVEPDFAATMACHAVGPELGITSIRARGHSVERTRRLAAADGRNDVLLNLQLHAQGAVTQHGRTAITDPGAMVLYETNEPYTIDLARPGQELMVLRFSRELLGLPERDIAGAAGRSIGPQVPGHASLSAYLRSLQDPLCAPDGIGPSLAAIAGQLLAAVLRSLLADDRPTHPDRAAQLAGLRAWLRRHLSDPELGVEELAARNFLSVRQVHALFAEDGDSPAAYLRRLRMEHATGLLAAGTSAPLGSIALACGYTDPASFARAFTRRYGMPPTRWAAAR